MCEFLVALFGNMMKKIILKEKICNYFKMIFTLSVMIQSEALEKTKICVSKRLKKYLHFHSNSKFTVAWLSSYNYVAITSIKIAAMTFNLYDKHGYH